MKSKIVILLTCAALLWRGVRAQESLTLKEAVLRAIQHQPTLAVGRAGVEIEKGLQTETTSAELPQITFNNTWLRANSRGSAFGSSSAFNVYSSIFSLNQLITDFGRTTALVEASREGVVGAKENLHQNLETVLLNVYQSYYQAQVAKAQVTVQTESVSNLKKHLDEAQTFFKVGTAPKIDVTQALVNLSNGKLALVQAQNNFDVAMTSLRAAMGEPDGGEYTLADTLTEPNYDITLTRSLGTAYEKRPDLKALLAQREGALYALRAAVREYFPTLSASATNGWIGSAFYPQNNTWSFGASFDVPIFNGLLREGHIHSAQGQLDQFSAQVDSLKLTIRQGVEQAFLNMQAAKATLSAARESLEYARENYELAEGRYKVGVGNYLEYTDAEVALTQAESNEIQALGSYNTAVASLKEAMGVLEAP